MEKGIWRKYKHNNKVNGDSMSSVKQLYNDTKNCKKKWNFVNNYEECYEKINGNINYGGSVSAGDVYVYYKDAGNGNLLPEFYIKVMKYNINPNEIHVEFNGTNRLEYSEICEENLPILINKLNEINAVKLENYIKEIEDRYKNYQTVVNLKAKKNYTESELLFLYEMAYGRKNISLARQIVKDRNIQRDYDGLTIDGKVNLFLSIKNREILNQLFITEKEVITKLSQNTVLSMLNNTTQEILDDKEYIMSLLEYYKQSDKISDSVSDIRDYLPIKYQTDLDVLKLIFLEYRNFGFQIEMWKRTNKDLEQKLNIPSFAYQLVDASARSWLDSNSCYNDLYLLPLLSNEILSNIENHVLIGPEISEEKENLKEESRTVIVKQKEYILNARKKRI